jgi:hypothetical protein
MLFACTYIYIYVIRSYIIHLLFSPRLEYIYEYNHINLSVVIVTYTYDKRAIASKQNRIFTILYRDKNAHVLLDGEMYAQINH